MKINSKRWQKLAGIIQESNTMHYNTEYSQPFEEELDPDIFDKKDMKNGEGSKPLNPDEFEKLPDYEAQFKDEDIMDDDEPDPEDLKTIGIGEESMVGLTGGPSKEGSIHLHAEDEDPDDEYSLDHLRYDDEEDDEYVSDLEDDFVLDTDSLDDMYDVKTSDLEDQLREDKMSEGVDYRARIVDHLKEKGMTEENILELLVRGLSDEEIYDALSDYLDDMQ